MTEDYAKGASYKGYDYENGNVLTGPYFLILLMSFVFRINDVFDRFNSSSLQMVDGTYRCHTGRFSFEAERLGQYEVEKVAMSYSILEAS